MREKIYRIQGKRAPGKCKRQRSVKRSEFDVTRSSRKPVSVVIHTEWEEVR